MTGHSICHPPPLLLSLGQHRHYMLLDCPAYPTPPPSKHADPACASAFAQAGRFVMVDGKKADTLLVSRPGLARNTLVQS